MLRAVAATNAAIHRGALKRLLKYANSSDAPALWTSVRDHHGIFCQHGNERVEVACGRGLCEGCEQALVGFRGSGKRALFLCDVFSRTFEELAVRGLLLADQLRNVV